jgi:transposase InsO family protein
VLSQRVKARDSIILIALLSPGISISLSLDVSGTFYYLCSILDVYSRLIVHWEIREQMCERDVEIILQRAKERYPQATPRII